MQSRGTLRRKRLHYSTSEREILQAKGKRIIKKVKVKCKVATFVLCGVRFLVCCESAPWHSRGKGFDPPHLHQREVLAEKQVLLFFVCFLQKGTRGIEEGAVQSDSPVDCRDRDRPSRAVRGASRSPSSPPEKASAKSRCLFRSAAHFARAVIFSSIATNRGSSRIGSYLSCFR